MRKTAMTREPRRFQRKASPNDYLPTSLGAPPQSVMQNIPSNTLQNASIGQSVPMAGQQSGSLQDILTANRGGKLSAALQSAPPPPATRPPAPVQGSGEFANQPTYMPFPTLTKEQMQQMMEYFRSFQTGQNAPMK